MRSLFLVVIGSFVVAAIAPAPALAYRTYADLPELADADGQPVAWQVFPIELEISEDDIAPLTTEDTEAALESAMELWNSEPCTQDIFDLRGTNDFAATSQDGVNTVQWVYENWSSRAALDAVATTHVNYQRVGAGYRLIEADIFLNAESIDWTGPLRAHLDGVLAHELGHVLGLGHPCEVAGTDGAPRCSGDASALMHPLYDPARAEITGDDKDGACFLYPEGGQPQEPAAKGSDGCAVTGPAVRGAASQRVVLGAMFVAFALLVRRRRNNARG